MATQPLQSVSTAQLQEMFGADPRITKFMARLATLVNSTIQTVDGQTVDINTLIADVAAIINGLSTFPTIYTSSIEHIIINASGFAVQFSNRTMICAGNPTVVNGGTVVFAASFLSGSVPSVCPVTIYRGGLTGGACAVFGTPTNTSFNVGNSLGVTEDYFYIAVGVWQ